MPMMQLQSYIVIPNIPGPELDKNNKSYDDSVKLKRTEMDPLRLGQVQFRGKEMKQREPEREPERA